MWEDKLKKDSRYCVDKVSRAHTLMWVMQLSISFLIHFSFVGGLRWWPSCSVRSCQPPCSRFHSGWTLKELFTQPGKWSMSLVLQWITYWKCTQLSSIKWCDIVQIMSDWTVEGISSWSLHHSAGCAGSNMATKLQTNPKAVSSHTLF